MSNKIKITVHFMGILGEIAEKKVELELDEGTHLNSLLNQLYEKLSSKLPKEFLDTDQKTFKMIHFMKNYKDIDMESKGKILDGDVFHLVPPLGGG